MQVLHTCVFAPAWTRRCFLRAELKVNVFSQISQAWAILPLWIRRCFVRRDIWGKVLSHILHGYGLFWWTKRCLSRVTFWENVFSHTLQAWLFSPLWMSRCLFRFFLSEKVFSHISHGCRFSHKLMIWCFRNSVLSWKVFSHFSHVNGLSLVDAELELKLAILEKVFAGNKIQCKYGGRLLSLWCLLRIHHLKNLYTIVTFLVVENEF